MRASSSKPSRKTRQSRNACRELCIEELATEWQARKEQSRHDWRQRDMASTSGPAKKCGECSHSLRHKETRPATMLTPWVAIVAEKSRPLGHLEVENCWRVCGALARADSRMSGSPCGLDCDAAVHGTYAGCSRLSERHVHSARLPNLQASHNLRFRSRLQPWRSTTADNAEPPAKRAKQGTCK